MFEGDGYLVLVADGEAAIAALSGVLVFLAVAAVRLARRWIHLRAAALGLGFACWWLFMWLTPQLYYLLYMTLVETLSFRWVIDRPPGPTRLVELLTFRARDTSVDIGVGILGWAMMLIALPRH